MPTPIITPISTLATTNTLGDGNSQQAALSQDGRFIVFTSDALNLSNKAFGVSNIYLKNTDSGAVTLLNMTATGTVADSNSSQADISGDGRLVVFQSYGSNLVSSDTNNDSDVFLKDTQTGVLKLISTTATGRVGDGFSGNPEISTDGRYVVFQSQASNLMEGDLNGAFDIYLKDLQTNTLSVLSRNADLLIGNGDSVSPSINADGRFVAFASDASNLVANDRNATRDVFLKNTQTGVITLISANGLGASGYGFSDSPSISADGSRVAFRSYATDLADVENDGNADIYVRDLTTGTLTVVSVGLDSKSANGNSFDPVISPDGRYVAFVSEASNLIPSDSNDMLDVFVADLTTGKIARVDWSSTPGDGGNPAFSGDGKTLAFNHWDNVSNNVYTWVNTVPPSSLPVLTVTDNVRINEGSANIPGSAVVTVSLSTASTQTVSVGYSTVNGTALAGSDYTTASGVLTFAPGDISKSFTIAVMGDDTVESDETLQVVLSSPVNATLGTPNNGTVTLVNDDVSPQTLPVVLSFASSAVSVKEGNSGITNAMVTVNLSQATTQRVTVGYNTVDGSALEDNDYVATNGTLIFEAGQTSKTIKIPIVSDTNPEQKEALKMVLSTPVNASLGSPDTATITIEDDDALPVMVAFASNAVTVKEGNSGISNAILTINLSTATTQRVTVNYSTADDSALEDNDYVATNGTLIFEAGQTSKTIKIPIVSDTNQEQTETLQMVLSAPVNASLGSPDTATITIEDDDALPVMVAFASNAVTVKEGNSGVSNATVTVNLSTISTQTVTVAYTTVDDSAKADNDYVATTGTLVFAPGVTSQSIRIPIVGDTLKESNETLKLALSSPVNANLGGSSNAVVTIMDDDPAGGKVIVGTLGAETLIGTTGNDTLSGLDGGDRLLGLAGNDWLTGGKGRDQLAGGPGADTFDFNDVIETGITTPTRDIIGDFKSSDGDKIDLSTIDADTRLAGDQAFVFIGTNAFSAPGQVRFSPQDKILYGSNDADTDPEFSIQFIGVTSLTAADFVL